MRKYIFVFVSFVILSFLLAGVSAVQQKMALDYCKYSLGDSGFGDWDGTEGVFFELRNENPDVGENADYVGINRQTDIGTAFSDTFTDNGEPPYGYDSYIPMLEVSSSNRIIYTRCYINVGNNLVVPDLYRALSLYNTDGVLLTQDFSLVDGIVQEGDSDYLIENLGYAGDDYDSSGEIHDFYFRVYDGAKLWQGPGVATVGDFQNEGSSGTGITELRQTILVPNSVLSIEASLDLNGVPSGLLKASTWFTENGQIHTIEQHGDLYFYIDSDYTPDSDSVASFLSPIISDLGVVVNPGSGEEVCSSVNPLLDDGCVFGEGDEIELSARLSNPFLRTLRETDFGQTSLILYGHPWANGGVGSESSVGLESKLVSMSTSVSSGDLAPGANNVLVQDTVNHPSLVGDVGGNDFVFLAPRMAYVASVGDSRSIDETWGGDGRTYLGFQGLDPTVTLTGGVPSFKLDFNLVNVVSGGSSNEISSGDYEILYEIYDSENPGVIVDSDTNVYSGGDLGEGETDLYSISIPIDTDLFDEPGAKYFVRVYSSPSSGELSGYKIAGLTANPFFKAGSAGYHFNAEDRSYALANDLRSEFKFIRLLNPTTESVSLKLSHNGLDAPESSGLKVIFETEGGSASPPNGDLVVDLDNFGDTELIKVIVQGDYGEPWDLPGGVTEFSDDFVVNVEDVAGDLGDSNLAFDVTVYEGDLEIVDIVPDSLTLFSEGEPVDTLFVGSTGEIQATAEWHVGGSSSGLDDYIGDTYDVQFQIYKEQIGGGYSLVSGSTVNLPDYAMPTSVSSDESNRVDEGVSINLPDDLTEGRYEIRFYVDSDGFETGGEINEISGSESLEGNNILPSTFVVVAGVCNVYCNGGDEGAATSVVNAGNYYYNHTDSGIYQCKGSDVLERVTSGCPSSGICQAASCAIVDIDLEDFEDYTCDDGSLANPKDPVCVLESDAEDCEGLGEEECYDEVSCTYDEECRDCASLRAENDGVIECEDYGNKGACEEDKCNAVLDCIWDEADMECMIDPSGGDDDEGPGGVDEDDIPVGCLDSGNTARDEIAEVYTVDRVCAEERFGELRYSHDLDPQNCDFSIPYACTESSIILPFFGFAQGVLSLLVIAYIYLFLFFFGRKG